MALTINQDQYQTHMESKANLYTPNTIISEAGDLIGFNGDPNTINVNTVDFGERVLVNAPALSLYASNNGQFYKKLPNGTWTEFISSDIIRPTTINQTGADLTIDNETHYNAEIHINAANGNIIIDSDNLEQGFECTFINFTTSDYTFPVFSNFQDVNVWDGKSHGEDYTTDAFVIKQGEIARFTVTDNTNKFLNIHVSGVVHDREITAASTEATLANSKFGDKFIVTENITILNVDLVVGDVLTCINSFTGTPTNYNNFIKDASVKVSEVSTFSFTFNTGTEPGVKNTADVVVDVTTDDEDNANAEGYNLANNTVRFGVAQPTYWKATLDDDFSTDVSSFITWVSDTTFTIHGGNAGDYNFYGGDKVTIEFR